MSTLTVPIGFFQATPTSRITYITSTKEGSFIIAGLADGTIVVFRCQNEVCDPINIDYSSFILYRTRSGRRISIGIRDGLGGSARGR